MKVAAVLMNDPHLDKDNGDLVKNIYNQAFNLCASYNTRNIIIGGDIFTNRSGQPLAVLKNFREIIEEGLEKDIDFFIIPGNHDKTDPTSDNSYVDLYGQYSNVNIFDQYGRRNLGNVFFHFVPYYEDKRWVEEYSKIRLEKYSKFINILITHIGVEGVVNNDGTKVESILKPSDFKIFDKVFIGHYHNSSKLAENVFYTGSCYQNNFGEDITDKGFTLIFENGDTKFVPSEFPRYIKKVIDVNDIETTRNLLEEYENSSDNIRFVFKGKKSDCQKISITEFSSRGVDVKFEIQETTEVIELAESDSIFEYDKKAVIKDFLNFCKENEIKGKRLVYGMELIKKIQYVES